MNDVPLNVQIENTRTKINNAISSSVMEYGLPAFLMSGILADILLEVKRQEKIELNSSYNQVLESLKKEIENKEV